LEGLFDNLKSVTHHAVTTVMGVTAYYTPSGSSIQQSARVLYNDPTTVEKLGEIEYSPNNFFVEYLAPSFPELKGKVDSGANEFITVKGAEYYVQKVKKMFDGDTFIAILEPKE
jgi:hypothetical protein